MAITLGRAPGGSVQTLNSDGSSSSVTSQNYGSSKASSFPAAASTPAAGSPVSLAQSIAGALGSSSDYGDIIRSGLDAMAKNSAMSQAFAREQMDFQRDSDRYAMNWSAKEADKTRKWQEEMSNTAHQREVADLINAGLNPVLSANAGAPSYSASATGQAFTSNGAMGSVDTTNPLNVLLGYYQSMINSGLQMAAMANQRDIAAANNETQLAAASISAGAYRYSADASVQQALINSGASQYKTNKEFESGELNRENQRYIADLDAFIQQYLHDNLSANTEYSSNKSFESSEYHTDNMNLSNRLISNFNNFLHDVFGNKSSRDTSTISKSQGGSGRSF